MTDISGLQAQHAQFADKHTTALAALAEARTAHTAAQTARVKLLDAIASGTDGKTTAHLAAADEAIRTAQHDAELHEALAEAAKRAKDRAQVDLWQAQAADIKTRLRDACAEQIEAGKALDAVMRAASEAAERFNHLSRRISAITHEGHSHDLMVLQEGSSVSALGAHQSTWPRTRIQGHPAQEPVFAKLQQENRGWPTRDVHSAEQVAQGTRGYFGTNLNAAQGSRK